MSIDVSDNEAFPLVCICVPVYNGARTIGQTLASLVNQDYPNYEIAVCDNMSSDNTAAIVDEYIKTHPSMIRYIVNPEKGSAEENWNYMLTNLSTTARYIALYHADDVYDPSIISKQLSFLESTGVGAVFTRSRIINENEEDITEEIGYRVNLPEEIKERVFTYDLLLKYTLKYHNIVRTPTLFCRAELVKNNKPFFNTAFRSSADLDAWLRIAASEGIGILDEALQSYRMSVTQGSYLLLKGQVKPADFFTVVDSHLNQVGKDRFRVELKYYNCFKAIDLIKCGRNLLIKEQKEEAKKMLKDACRLPVIPKIFTRPGWMLGYIFGIFLLLTVNINLEGLVIKLTNNNKRFV